MTLHTTILGGLSSTSAWSRIPGRNYNPGVLQCPQRYLHGSQLSRLVRAAFIKDPLSRWPTTSGVGTERNPGDRHLPLGVQAAPMKDLRSRCPTTFSGFPERHISDRHLPQAPQATPSMNLQSRWSTKSSGLPERHLGGWHLPRDAQLSPMKDLPRLAVFQNKT